MTINVEHFKKMFLEMKNGNVALDSNDEMGSTRLGGDDADLANAERDRAMVLKLKQREAFFFRKIDEALTKIENGEFGQCEDCGGDIGEKRLLARPTASMCINCKEEHERNEGHLLYAKRSKTIGTELITNGETLEKAFKEVQKYAAV
ncbi:putative RNA polymerase-binding protein DksA [Bacteriovorax sp. BSW11_IV]|uniref:TraR/DksA family transcriptional regulator n=1 Tax=Bacteriovorax sp. BSW11_IV TaxID=1353529 RepID=UPI00038A11D9|nr:TraR/DksA C4-type zinc finger protein [Bacteriovorax sp. BSW11_IV]EQC44623.1 putative RNA polymerase-binding protein DksA [Bacteriovorax sp. BSW11_IV]